MRLQKEQPFFLQRLLLNQKINKKQKYPFQWIKYKLAGCLCKGAEIIHSKVKPNMNGFMGSFGYFPHVLPYTAEPVFDVLPTDN